MAFRSSPSRNSSRSRLGPSSRRSSVASDRNVFSDDYAMSLANSSDASSRIDVPITTSEVSVEHARDCDSSNIVPYPVIPDRLSNAISSSKQPLLIDDAPSPNEGGVGRSASVSSRFSIPRSQSPYMGPTAPSHPYTMYSQVTRVPSVASEVTVRPHAETPFVPSGGPEHPYSLYPQNTVDEEEEDVTAGGIPIGFHGPSNYQNPSGNSNSDVGDIVGTDGHVEQLPPYTRYADNTVAKGNMEHLNRTVSRRVTRPETPRASTSSISGPSHQAAASAVDSTEPLQPIESFDSEEVEAVARKEGWKTKAQRRVCGGMPLWCLVLIVTVIILAGILGGVIGGVIGNRQGETRAWASGAVTTVWLDADPATTSAGTPTLPTGRYVIPLNQSQEINSCIAESSYGSAWGCMDIAFIGVTVSQAVGNVPMQARFDDYSVNTQDFKYGPQPPDFNGTSFDLDVVKDKDDAELGIAMYFHVLFDKLSIIPEGAITPLQGKRSISARHLRKRTARYDGTPLQIGDYPWFCFWNSTLNEFWIFLEQNSPTETASTFTPTATGSGAYNASSAATSTSGVVAEEYRTHVTTTTTQAFTASIPVYSPSPVKSSSTAATPTGTGQRKRSYTTRSPYMPDYPKLIKMVEKRKPHSNIQPYCQKMMVVEGFQIVPAPDEQTICIDEVDYSTATSTGGAFKRRDEMTDQLQSNCICEWLSY